MTFWKSPWRRVIREGRPHIVADVATSRKDRKRGLEVCFDLEDLRTMTPDDRKNVVAAVFAEALTTCFGSNIEPEQVPVAYFA